MKAITFHAPGELRLESVADPAPSTPGAVVIDVELAGICGSDLHVYHGAETGLDVGTVLGHEYVGQIIECGPEVRRFAVGDRVVGPFTTNCGDCFHCRRDETARCERGQLFGWVEGGHGLQGAQAELLEVPLADSTLTLLPDGLPPELAMLAGDVLPTGLYCADRAEVTDGSRVAVVGCGPVGLMAVMAAHAAGAATVWALDREPERLAFAARFGGLPLHVESVDDPASELRRLTGGRGVDAVLEAVGSPAATRLAFDAVRPCGTIAAVGVHTEESLAFSPGEAYDKNLTYRAGRCPARVYLEDALELLRQRQRELLPLISHRMPLAEGRDGYEIFAARRDGCTKIVLDCRG